LSRTTHQQTDIRGWVLVHDQIRAVLVALPTYVRALRADDPVGARTLVPWWRSFSSSFLLHLRAEDARIWPVIAEADPGAAEELGRLAAEHHEIARQLAGVDTELAALPELLASRRLEPTKRDLLRRLDVLQCVVDHHLAAEERIAFDHRDLPPEQWGRIERDLVKELGLREISLLLPRLLEQADPVGRALMLRRMPASVRMLDARVFEPRYRRMQRRLPGSAVR
jgi:hypothetical protein